MDKINKCYICTKEYNCSIEQDFIHNCFIFQFGDGELVDEYGDSFSIYCELNFVTQEKVIQLWYEDYAVTIYSEKPENMIVKSCLKKEEVNEILREFHRLFNLFKEEE